MKQIVTTGIVLSRTNYGEADRIITIITPDQGKVRLMAQGVRKIKAKLAGGIELFSVSSISFIRGKRDVGTLTSARLIKHYDQIAKHIDRTLLGYDLIKQINYLTEDEPETAWFICLEHALEALNNPAIDLDVISFWFAIQVLKISGRSPNLHLDAGGVALRADQIYSFDVTTMSFLPTESGSFRTDHIKLLRIGFSNTDMEILRRVSNVGQLSKDWLSVLQEMVYLSLRI